MKVKGSRAASGGATPAGGAKGGGPARSDAVFSSALGAAQRDILDGDLQALLDEVGLRGKRFMRSPDEKTLESYKDSIRQFLRRVSVEIFQLRSESGRPQDGQQKIYQVVETVQHEIDMLTRETLQKDKALAMLATLDDIRGLVLDLLS